MSVLSIVVAQYHMDLIQIRQQHERVVEWRDDRALGIDTQPCISSWSKRAHLTSAQDWISSYAAIDSHQDQYRNYISAIYNTAHIKYTHRLQWVIY